MTVIYIITTLLAVLDVIGTAEYDKETARIKKSLLEIRDSINKSKTVNNSQINKINQYIDYTKSLQSTIDPRIWNQITDKIGSLQNKAAQLQDTNDRLDSKIVEAETLADGNRPTGVSRVFQATSRLGLNDGLEKSQSDVNRLEQIAKEVK